MNNQLQLRDWQQIKQAMALKFAGTPEGAAALAESRRYGLAADRIEELAAQVAALRGLLIAARPRFGTAGSRDVDVAARQDAFDAALAIPFDTDILRQRDARVLREVQRRAIRSGCNFATYGDVCRELERTADELEKQNG